MRHYLVLFSILFFKSFGFYGQSIFSNPITGINPNLLNPYTNGQLVDPNCTVSGIGRGSGILGKNANNRYNAIGWNTAVIDSNKYFEFVITPISGKRIDFLSFYFLGQISLYGPSHFVFRSSIDGFSTNIATLVGTGGTVSLSDPNFQNIIEPITFRIYSWGATNGNATFSINKFDFKGTTDCALPEKPRLTDIPISCSSTSFEVNWVPPFLAKNYIFDVATDPSFNNPVVGYFNLLLENVTNQIVVGITAGETYYVRLRAMNDCGLSNYSNTSIVFSPSTTFDGVSWDNDLPDSTKKVVFAGNATIVSPLNACSVKINPGVNVVVGETGGTNGTAILHLENGLEVVGTGALTFENNASLIQVNDAAVNSGKITYKRISSPMKIFDFTDWSSPVSGQTLKELSPNTLSDKYFSFWDRVWITENSDNTMLTGKGYTIRTPKEGVWGAPYPETVVFPYRQPVSFIGTPNNGIYTVAVNPNAGRYSFIGNPYPSALNADVFVSNNAGAIKGTIYIWTHNTSITQNGTNYIYSQDDYASYNAFLGAGVAAASSTVSGANDKAPTGKIAAGQGFFVISTTGTTGSIVFNNSMREHSVANNSQFFKGSSTKKSSIERHRVWLSLSNIQGAFKQILIGYATGATNGDDVLFDGSNYSKNAYIDFCSLISTKKCVIQGRALPFDKKDEVPLGYKSSIDGSFSISIDQIDGVLASQDVFLQDKTASIYYNLKKGPYTFNTLKGTFDDRFALVYVDKLDVVEPTMKDIPSIVLLDAKSKYFSIDNKEKAVMVFVKNHQINVDSFEENIESVLVFDLKGRVLYKKDNIAKKQFFATDFLPTNQILIVKTILSNAAIKTYKLFF
ncbi:Fibronectin type III [Flavobacteriaceae bacterium]